MTVHGGRSFLYLSKDILVRVTTDGQYVSFALRSHGLSLCSVLIDLYAPFANCTFCLCFCNTFPFESPLSVLHLSFILNF